MKYIITLLFVFLLNCNNTETQNYEVKFKGALREMMHAGNLTSRMALSELENLENLYALGATENLKGEIQIFNSKPYNSAERNADVVIENSFDENASLLVYAQVENWIDVDIPSNIVTYQELEVFVFEQAKLNKIDIENPFPFMMNGIVKSIDWHVINWKDGDTEHSHKKHVESGPHGTLENANLEILGFYSNKHHAIFTHHTTNMHLHFRKLDNTLAGHIDGMIFGENMMLRLPK